MVPAEWLGAVATICVSETIVKFAAVVPKKTCVVPAPPEKFNPLIVTGVPPAIGPEFGMIADTTGVKSTASKLLPKIVVSLCKSSSFQRVDGAPLKNQLLPLSATIMP